jgi:hypothetical protein
MTAPDRLTLIAAGYGVERAPDGTWRTLHHGVICADDYATLDDAWAAIADERADQHDADGDCVDCGPGRAPCCPACREDGRAVRAR